MEDVSIHSAETLQKLILKQKTQIAETRDSITKYQLMIKRQQEHLSRLEQKNDSLIHEKKFLSTERQKLSRELDLLSGHTPKQTILNLEADKSVTPKQLEFVKQTPLAGLTYIKEEISSIESQLTFTSPSKATKNSSQKRAFEVIFQSESCIIRSSNQNYTFNNLASDAAVYFTLIPEDCILFDEHGLIWPSHGKVLDEYNEKENKLILKLKYGRVARNPIAAEANWQEIAANIKLETRLERMKNWVVDKEVRVVKKREKQEGIIKSICEISLYLTFLVLLFITVFAPISIKNAYQLNSSLQNLFITQEFPQDCDYPDGLGIIFENIYKPGQFFCWYQSIVVDQLFGTLDIQTDNNKLFILRYNQLGGIQLRQSRVKMNSCDALNYKTGEVDKSLDCYAEYSESTKSKEDFGQFPTNFSCSDFSCEYAKAFKYNSDIQGSYEITGKLATYGKSGYSISTDQLLINGTFDYDILQALGAFLKEHLWIDKMTRMISVHFSFYNINYNYFTNMEILLEISGTGYVYTRTKLNTLFLNYYYDSWNNMSRSGAQFFDKFPEVFCYVYNFLGVLWPLGVKLKRNFRNEVKKMWTYIDVCLFLLVVGIIVLRVILYYVCDEIIQSIATQSFNKTTNFSQANFYLNISWALEAFSVLAASLKLLNYFSIQSMTIIWDTLQRGAKSIFAFFIVFLTLICSFSQTVHIIYGNELEIFTTFTLSLSHLFMIILGAIDNYQIMSVASPVFTPLFYIFFMFLMFFVIMNIFVAILNEAYGVVIELQSESQEKELVGKLKNMLIAEIRHYIERIRYCCKKCCKKTQVERSLAFKAFNRN